LNTRNGGTGGFDWPDIQGVMNIIAEEIEELRTASPETRAGEIGDLFFALVNLGRWYQVDAESALRETTCAFASICLY
jgi:tetrapyrrole methylase family protein/MazG family protein